MRKLHPLPSSTGAGFGQFVADPSSRPSIFVAAAGAWLAVTPLVVDNPAAYPWWNDVAAGSVIAVAGLVRVAVPRGTTVLSLLNLLVGVWVIAAPFVLSFPARAGVVWNDVIVGIIVVLLAAVTAFVEPVPPPRE